MAKKSAKKTVKRKSSGVSAEEFCKAWAKASKDDKTIDDLAKTLGMEKKCCPSPQKQLRLYARIEIPQAGPEEFRPASG